MNQSTVLVGGVLAMWLVYLAANSRFAAYLAVVWPRSTAAESGPTTPTAPGTSSAPGAAKISPTASSALGLGGFGSALGSASGIVGSLLSGGEDLFGGLL